MTSVVQLTQHFAKVDQQMRDLPIYNPALTVQAVGFRVWQERMLGVLITPWFMNLVLLPSDTERWSDAKQGDTLTLALPSGAYNFIYGWAEQTRGYASCSLFSPMTEFSDPASAEATAEAVMDALFSIEHREQIDSQPVTAKPAEMPSTPAKPKALSRRAFLTGGRSRAQTTDSQP